MTWGKKSTCHWCHVMAHESFEDERVASLLNEHFVCIKVDREERPDLDAIYMNFCQLMTKSGGWPLNLWLTPEQVPIYAGTYFPKEDIYGRAGFISVITHLQKLWRDDRDELMDKSSAVLAHVNHYSISHPEAVDPFVTIQTVRDLKERFDDVYGGFSGAPKFPSPHQLLYLMHHYQKQPSTAVLNMVTKTLDSMYAGGIYDHVGGGFARYSVDARWLVPHFEKMLYDNALLLRVYNLAYRLTGNELYKSVAYDIVRFLKREMLGPDGGFHTAIDADSEGVEGKYYVYTQEEIIQLLGDDAKPYCSRYGISAAGNFEGHNIPNLIGKEVSAASMQAFDEMNQRLLNYRKMRVAPIKDNKVLTSVNGLLMTSLAAMYRLYGDDELLKLSVGIEGFLAENIEMDGGLSGSITQGKVGPAGVLEDYAFYIEGLIELYQATFSSKYLNKAISITDILKSKFWDEEAGGYYITAKDHETLITRPKEAYDSASPSGNSVMALNLMKLSRLKEDLSFQKDFDGIIKAFGKKIKQGPSYFCYMMIGLLYRQEGTRDLVIAVPGDMDGYTASGQQLLAYFSVRLSDEGEDKKAVDGEVTYYICEDFACGLPVKALT